MHAVGRVLREPSDIRLNRTLGELPIRQADFTGHSHNVLTVAAGLAYGPGFRAIDHGWVEGTVALAVLDLPLAVRAEIDQHHLHPALVDCAFQLIIQLLRDSAADYEGVTLVPTRIGHLSFRRGMGQPAGVVPA